MTVREEFESWFKNKVIEKSDFVFNDFDDNNDEYVVSCDDDDNIIGLYLNIQAMYMAFKAGWERRA